MRQFTFILLIFTILFSGCNKDGDEPTISFKVVATGKNYSLKIRNNESILVNETALTIDKTYDLTVTMGSAYIDLSSPQAATVKVYKNDVLLETISVSNGSKGSYYEL